MKWEKRSLRIPAGVFGMLSSRALRMDFSRSDPFCPLARAMSMQLSTTAEATGGC